MMYPKVNRYYKHKYGGIYRVIELAESVVDNSVWVVYNHVYPYEYKVWVRPLHEWTDDRFSILTNDEYHSEIVKDRENFRAEIEQRKLLLKG